MDVAITCAGKVPFDNKQMAREAAARRPGREAYRCPHCNMYHVGTVWRMSLKDRQRKRARRRRR